jgi:uncharacterized membrane protein YeiH
MQCWGGIVARRQKMDPIGFVALAVLSGLGGGVLRDVLLQHGHPAALIDYAYIGTAVLGALVPFANRLEQDLSPKLCILLNTADAVNVSAQG